MANTSDQLPEPNQLLAPSTPPPADTIDSIDTGLSISQRLPSNSLSNGSELDNLGAYLSSMTFGASAMLFVLSILVFILISNRLRDSGHQAQPSDILKTFGVPLIVVSAVFVVILTRDEKTVTPIIGLMGTIAGYLLGKSDSQPPPVVRESAEQIHYHNPPPPASPPTSASPPAPTSPATASSSSGRRQTAHTEHS